MLRLNLRWVISGVFGCLLWGFIQQTPAYSAVCEQSTVFPSSFSALFAPLASPNNPLPNINLLHEVRQQRPPRQGMSAQRYEQTMQALQLQFGRNVQARWNRGTGQLRSLRHPKKLLSRKRYRKARVGARRFLRRHADLLGLPSDGNLSWKISGEHTLKRLGVTHVTFQWYWQDIPVVDAALQVDVNKRGRVLNVAGNIPSSFSDVRVEPKISAAEAVLLGVQHVTGELMGWPEVVDGPHGSTRLTKFALPAMGIPGMVHQAGLVIVPLPSQARIAWDVRFHHDWHARYRLFIDAETGQVLVRTNLVQFTQPQGLVFPDHPDAGAATVQSFVGDLMVSPQGWLEATAPGVFSSLRGNNACVQEDRDASNALGYSPAEFDGHFEFPFQNAYQLSNGADVDTDLDAALTNAFYHVNWAHDYFYHLGFDEEAGNFQADNFGNGGFEHDEVHTDVQDRWDLNQHNNAFFFTPADSSSTSSKPRLDLRVGRTPQFRNIDLAFSRDIIVHEYSHGVSCRLVGGPTSTCTLFGTQSGALGEGWSDWFAAHTGEDPVFGEYLTGKPLIGLRKYAINQNPLTYGDLCSTGCQVHRDGEIWSATLWDIRQNLIDTYGDTLGRARAEQVILDGLTFTPANPSMLDARDGILAADQASGEMDKDLLWEVFACRGMGMLANSNGQGDRSPQESFVIEAGVSCPGRLADVSITKTVSHNPMVLGQQATYDLVVTNAGPEVATQVRVEDVLPAGLTLGTVTWSQGTCTGVGTLECQLGALHAGASATISINATPTVAGLVTNTATVQLLGADSNESNNASSVSTPVHVPLTMTIIGDGSGLVMSNPSGLSCAAGTCTWAFPANTFVQFTSEPELLSMFEGWTGDPDCSDGQVQITTALNCSATFTRMTLDVDGNGVDDPMTDGNLIIRYMKGLRGHDLIAGIVDTQGIRSTSEAIVMYLDASGTTMLDVDQNSLVEEQIDGMLILRFLFGLRGDAMTQGLIGQGAVRDTTTEIELFLTQFLPS